MIIHEARQGITSASRDILTGPIDPSGIASISAPNLQLNTHAQEPNRLQTPLNPNGIVFEGPQTPYSELRGAVSEVLRDIGIRDVKDREEMLRSFDTLHEGEEKAVADFQATLGDFKDGTVNPILQQYYDFIAEAQKIGSYIKVGGGAVELASLVSGYLLVDYLRRRHLKGSQHPSSHRTARSINKLGRSLSWVAVGSTLLAACASATGAISSTATPPAPGATGLVSQTPAPTDVSPASPSAILTPVKDATNTAEPSNLPQDAILPAEWAAYTAEGENKGKYNPELFFQLVGGVNHQNRKTVSLETNGLKIAVALDEQYFIDHEIDPLLGLTALGQEDQQALAEALSKQLDNIPELKAQLSSIRTQIAANEGDLLSKDITRYTVIIQNGQVTGIVFYTGLDVTRRYALNAEGKLVRLASELEPQLLPELRVNGPYIERADTGEELEFKGVSIVLTDIGREYYGLSIYEYVKRNIEQGRKVGLVSNIVRLTFQSKDISESDLDNFLKVADYLDRQGIYMIVTPHNDQSNQSNDNWFLPNESDKQLLVNLAAKLKNRQNIIYGLWNEPANTNWYQWGGIIGEMYKRLSAEFNQGKPYPIIMVSGIEWSRDFRGAIIPLPENSYIIDVHNYTYTNHTPVEYMWTGMIGKVHIMISEMGDFDVGGGPGTSKDLETIARTFDIIHQYPGQLSYSMWREIGDQGVLKSLDGGLTIRGRTVVQEREKFPDQTDFTK